MSAFGCHSTSLVTITDDGGGVGADTASVTVVRD